MAHTNDTRQSDGDEIADQDLPPGLVELLFQLGERIQDAADAFGDQMMGDLTPHGRGLAAQRTAMAVIGYATELAARGGELVGIAGSSRSTNRESAESLVATSPGGVS